MLELIIVIIVLGTLFTVAIPRFIDLTGDSHKQSVATSGAALTIAVQQVHLRYVLSKLSGAQDNLAGFGDGTVDVNAQGYPTDTNGANRINPPRCARVWLGILQVAPSVSNRRPDKPDYLAGRAGDTCVFTYLKDTTTTRRILYNSLTGEVTLVNP